MSRGLSRQTLPPGLAALKASIEELVTPDVMKEIVQAQVNKARKGDAGAAKFVFDLVAAIQPPVGPAPAPPADDDDEPPPPRPPSVKTIRATATITGKTDIRSQVRAYLRRCGQATPRELAEALMLETHQIDSVLLSDDAIRRVKGTAAFELA